jgi:hypothetical protein
VTARRETTRRLPLGEIALARSGDKGAHANIGVWVHSDEAYELIVTALTSEVVAAHFAAMHPSRVERYELANVKALNFVLIGALGRGGGSAGLRTDAQAKAYGQALLRLEIDIPADVLASSRRAALGKGRTA